MNEIVALGDDGSVFCLDTRNGSVVWRVNFSPYARVSPPSIVDADQDGDLDLVLNSGDGLLRCIDGQNGTSLWVSNWTNYYLTDKFCGSAISDVDGDGRREVFTVVNGSRLICSDLATGSLKWNKGTGLSFANAPVCTDVNIDGAKEIIVAGDEGVICFDKDGNQLWFYPIGGGWLAGEIAIADIDGDNHVEIFVGGTTPRTIDCIKGTDGRRVWQKILAREPISGCSVADVTGDGVLDVVVGTFNGYACLNARTGGIHWEIMAPTNPEFSPALVDIDHDCEVEIIATTAYYPSGSSRGMRVFSASNGDIEQEWLTVPDWSYDRCLPADIRGDGTVSVLIDNWNGWIAAVEGAGRTTDIQPPWGCATSSPASTAEFLDGDGDGIPTSMETYIGTSASLADTDGDGLDDLEEISRYHTDPLAGDSDGDGFSDRTEILQGTSPRSSDTDGDGLVDDAEALIYHTSAVNVDTDEDGVDDWLEVFAAHTDPLNPDSDGDSVMDGVEIGDGTNPLAPDDSRLAFVMVVLATFLIMLPALLCVNFLGRASIIASRAAYNWLLPLRGHMMVDSVKITCTRGSLDLSGKAIASLSVLQNLRLMRGVEEIDLSKNCLSTIGAFPSIKSLSHLNLSNNIIDGNIDVSGCKCLRSLDLSHNRIHDRASITLPPTLEELDISGNPYSESLAISNLDKVVELTVGGDNLSGVEEINRALSARIIRIVDGGGLSRSRIHGLPNLEVLVISGCTLEWLELHDLPRLTRIDVHHNTLSHLSIDHCPLVSIIDARDNKLAQLTLNDATSVRQVDLSGNPVVIDGLREIALASSIEQLAIDVGAVPDLAMEFLGGLSDKGYFKDIEKFRAWATDPDGFIEREKTGKARRDEIERQRKEAVAEHLARVNERMRIEQEAARQKRIAEQRARAEARKHHETPPPQEPPFDREAVLSTIEESKFGASFAEISSRLSVKKVWRSSLHETIDALIAEGKIERHGTQYLPKQINGGA